ncbi:MAG TPA: DMT family transporter [Terracidiphilus sp.]|jgi:transporter family protein
MAWLGYAILALVLWGVTGVTQKLSTNRISSERSFLWFCWAMVALSGVVVVVARPHWGLGTLVVACSVAGGALNGLGAWTSFKALESGGKASIVISLISLFPLLTVVLAVALLHERLTWMQAAGAVVAIAAAILLSLEPAPAKAEAQSAGV